MSTSRMKAIWNELSGENKINCGKSGLKTYKLSKADRSIHGLVLGSSGSGKSRLALHLATQSMEQGEGVGVVDPKGDLYQRFLEAIHEHVRKQKVTPKGKYVLFDPTSSERLPGFNPLEVPEGEDPYPHAMAILDVLKKLWSHSWGPRMENLLRNVLIALMENNLTLVEAEKFLTDPDFREMLVEDLQNNQVRHFWLERYPDIPQQERSVWVEPVLNKIGAFVTSPVISEIVGQKNSTIDFREILDQGKVLAVNLPKSLLGPQVSHLLGALLVARINQAAISRADIPESERSQYHLHVDEFQNLASPSFKEVLAEARSFKLSLKLLSQDFEGITEPLKASVLANAKLLFCFRVSREDAETMAKALFRPSGLTAKYVPEKDTFGKPKSNPTFRSIHGEMEKKVQELVDLEPRKVYMKVRGQGGPKLMRTITTPEYDIPRNELANFANRLMEPYTRTREGIRRELDDRRARLEERTEQYVMGE